MVLRSVRTRALAGSVLAAAALTLAACGSSSAPSSTTAAAVTTTAAAAATTTVAESTTTTAPADRTLSVINEMTDCTSLEGVLKSSQIDLDAAKDDYYKKLYGDRVAAAKAKSAELKCPAA